MILILVSWKVCLVKMSASVSFNSKLKATYNFLTRPPITPSGVVFYNNVLFKVIFVMIHVVLIIVFLFKFNFVIKCSGLFV